MRDELERLKPPELIVPQDADLTFLQLNMPVTKLDNYHFETEVARQVLLEHFGTATLDVRELQRAAAGNWPPPGH